MGTWAGAGGWTDGPILGATKAAVPNVVCCQGDPPVSDFSAKLPGVIDDNFCIECPAPRSQIRRT